MARPQCETPLVGFSHFLKVANLKGHVNECLILIVKDSSLGLIQMCEHKGTKKKRKTNIQTNVVGMHSNKENRFYSLWWLHLQGLCSLALNQSGHTPPLSNLLWCLTTKGWALYLWLLLGVIWSFFYLECFDCSPWLQKNREAFWKWSTTTTNTTMMPKSCWTGVVVYWVQSDTRLLVWWLLVGVLLSCFASIFHLHLQPTSPNNSYEN